MVESLTAEFGWNLHPLILTEVEFEEHPLRDMHKLILIS